MYPNVAYYVFFCFADDCILKNINNENIENFQKDLDRLGEWTAENEMKINPSKRKAVHFSRTGLRTG